MATVVRQMEPVPRAENGASTFRFLSRQSGKRSPTVIARRQVILGTFKPTVWGSRESKREQKN